MEFRDWLTLGTLLVTAAGWFFTHRSQRSLAASQYKHDREKEVRSVLAPARFRQLDEIENWLSEAMPITLHLMNSPAATDKHPQSEGWHLRVPTLMHIARQHDPTAAVAFETDFWTPEATTLPSDLPQLIEAISIMSMQCDVDLLNGNKDAASQAFAKMANLHGKAYDALGRVRRLVAAAAD